MINELRKYLDVFRYESILTVKQSLQYKVGLISDFIIFALIYISSYFINSGKVLSKFYNTDAKGGIVLLLFGFIFWQFNVVALGYCSSVISSEARAGTLEIKLQSKFSPVPLLMVRVLLNVLINSVILIVLTIFTMIYFKINFRDVEYILLSFLVAIPSIMGMFGIGTIVGGITLKEKKIGQFLLIVQGLLLFISNIYTPTSSFLSDFLPFPIGIKIIRDLYVSNFNIGSMLVEYLAINIIWFLIGIVTFNLFLKRERKYGFFDTY